MPSALDTARRLVRPLTSATGVEAAFLAGSLTAGLGNATSDVDLYTLGADLPAVRDQVFAGEFRVDVHRMPTGEFAAAVGRVLAARLPSDGSAPLVAERDLLLAVYLSTGEVLMDRGPLAPLCAAVRDNAALLRRLVVSYWLMKAHFEIEDLAGLVAERDWAAAAMVSRELQLVAGKALMAGAGDLYAGRKWLWRQLARSAPAPFPVPEFTAAMCVVLAPGGEAATIARVRHLAHTCLAAAATLGWHGVPLHRWPRWLPGQGGLARSDVVSVRAYTDAVLLTLPDRRRVRLGHGVALVWAVCDGFPPEQAAAEAAGLADGVAAYAGLTAARSRAILGRLIDARLIAVSPAGPGSGRLLASPAGEEPA